MFKKAYEIANKFTYPLVISIRFHNKTVESGLGAFILLNDEGWLITAAHNLGAAFAFNQHQKEIEAYEKKVDEIKSKKDLSESEREDTISAIQSNPRWITSFSIMFGGRSIKVLEKYIYQENDIAFIRIDKNAITGQTIFPKIIDPKKIRPGTSLCKFGYPFVEVKSRFNPTTKNFEILNNLLPVPFFPIEGIYTRNLVMGKTRDGSADIKYLETSSPGLKGQSGGPICDTDGNIYAIQSKNATLPLGFKGRVKIKTKSIEEFQFLNVGLGVHPDTIVTLLNKHNIKFDSADIE